MRNFSRRCRAREYAWFEAKLLGWKKRMVY
jgi:hypothetical protein